MLRISLSEWSLSKNEFGLENIFEMVVFCSVMSASPRRSWGSASYQTQGNLSAQMSLLCLNLKINGELDVHNLNCDAETLHQMNSKPLAPPIPLKEKVM